MDICFERFSSKSLKLKINDGWRNMKNKFSKKRISPTFRYLIGEDKKCRENFLDFFLSKEKWGLINTLKNGIIIKFDKKKTVNKSSSKSQQ